MKVTVKEGLIGFSGRLDGAVYYYHPHLKRTVMRKKPIMPIQAQNHQYRRIAKQIKAIAPSANYKQDFRIYLTLLRRQNEDIVAPSWYGIYIKMLWAMQKKYPQSVNLETLTKEQILSENLPCISVKSAVEDGLLDKVDGWETLTRSISD